MNKNYIFLLSITLLVSSCKEQWDPNVQFSRQAEHIKLQQENYEAELESSAKDRLKSLEGNLLLQVKSGISNSQLTNLVGFKYIVLAQNKELGQNWERRLYKWEDIVESKWGTSSLEFKFCKKNIDFFVVTKNDINVVNIEYL